MNARITILLGLGQAARITLLFLACVGAVNAAQTNASRVEPVKGDVTYQLEFRARNKTQEGYMHALIVLWEKRENGERKEIKSAGFYPKDSGVKNVLYGPGDVLSPEALSDTDKTFTVHINDEQMRRVDWIVKNWENKTYSLGFQDCVSMVSDVALSVGLKIRDLDLEHYEPFPTPAPIGPEILTPEALIRRLSTFNDVDTPIKVAESVAVERRIKQRNDQSRVLQRVQRAAEREGKYPKPGREITPTNPNDRWELQLSPPNSPPFKGTIRNEVK